MSISKNTPKTGVLASGNQALTSSYVTFPSTGYVSASGYDQMSLLIDYTKGDETNLDFKVQFSDTTAFTDAFERVVLSTDATGVSDCLSNAFKRTSTGKIEVPISIRGLYLRVQFKATGGTPTGTFNARYRLENVER